MPEDIAAAEARRFLAAVGERASADRPAGVRPLIAALPFSKIGQVAMPALGDPGVIPLWFGESDVPTPGFICDAAATALRAGETFYTFKRGVPELRRTIARYLTGLYAKPVASERIIVTSSGMSGIMLMCQALVEPGDNIVIVSPVWPNINDAVTVMGGEARAVALSPATSGGWRLDIDRLMAACDARTRAIFVNSPNNPTGWTMRRDEAVALLAFTRRRGFWLIADEVYGRLVYDGTAAAPSLLDLAEPEDRVVVVNSFSKAWAMTGWRLGWLVAPKEIQDVADTLVELNTSGAPTFLQHAGIAAIRDGEGFVAEMLACCRRGRDLLVNGLQRFPRVDVAAPDGAFYAFCRVDGLTDSLGFAKEILARAKVGVAPGSAFGLGGEGHLRLCFASAPERLSQALERLGPMLG
ncbi:MAG TPA: pyridoxal phosphate-dependent aminotransferase [Stellaceae bacterium]|nr:pyridoxal phosphate-dependent aminotransferase [Stellaceae bacterium]